MFHSASLEGYTSSINKAVDVLSDNLQSAAEQGEVVDMWRQLGKMTMQVGRPCWHLLANHATQREAGVVHWPGTLLACSTATLNGLLLAPCSAVICLLLSDDLVLTTCLYVQVIGASAFG